jgi:quinoprotein relay system zinc metallohydrolase 2
VAFPLRLERWLAGLTVLCFTAPCAQSAASFAVKPLAPGEFVHLGRPLPLTAPGHDDIANIGFIIGRRCVAVIDTGGSLRTGQALRAAIGARTALPVCYVINTHVHVDHLLGNAAFLADHAQFVGHAQLPVALERSRDFFLKTYAADLGGAELVGPERTVAVGQDVTLDLGERHLTLRAWPPAHTDCDLTVYDELSGTLWSGDLLFVGRTPAVDGSIRGWLTVLDTLPAIPARQVVPGHGPVSGALRAALGPERTYLQALLTQVRTELEHGVPLQQALAEPLPGEQSRWQLWDETHPRNVARVYQELEWE